MKKRLYVYAMCMLVNMILGTSIFAQQNVKGVLKSSSGEPLAGATITIKGTKKTVTTDAAGNFSINAAKGDVLVVSFIGYENREIKLNDGTPLAINLAPTASSMNEVVVIGYGTTRKKDATGSVTTVGAKDFQKGNITTPEQLIAGKVAGVSVISNSGQPGAGSTIRIRGGSSLNASNDPLIVIDGIPLDNSLISGAGNPLSLVNPNDIETFTVLKDASATAIYGTRASNGVILITTKKGTGGKLKVNFSSINSLSVINKYVDVLTADQFRAVVNANGTAAQKAMLGTANTDWQKAIFHDAFATDNNISISGGIKGLPYRVSFGYQNQNGILKTDNLQKTSLSVAINPSFFTNHLKVDINLKGVSQNTRFANTAAIGGATSFDPTQPIYSNSKRYGGYYEWVDATGALINLAGRNPVGLLNQNINKGTPERFIGNVQMDYKFHFLPELRANVNVGVDAAKGTGTVFVPDSAAASYNRAGISTQYKQTKQNTTLEFYLSYAKDFKAIKSHFDVLAGYSYYDYLTTNYNFADYNAHGVKIANSDPAFPFDKPEYDLTSFFGRANYSFKDRYLLTATLRRDRSSRFGDANKWALFPSVAFAWKIKEESFLKNSNTFSDLKMRLGYGVTGQQDGIGNFVYLSDYALSSTNASYQFGNSFYQMYRPSGYNPNIKWEQTATYNAGLDYGLLKNRITGSIDFYIKKTKDLLTSVPQPAGSNFSAYVLANVGSMENKGVEFSINTQPIVTRNLTWDIGFNVTYNKNTITNLTVIPGDTSYLGYPSGTIAGGVGGQFAFINAVGGSKNTFYLYKQVYDKAGNPVEGVFNDKNGDGIINQSDLYKGKSSDPKVFLGFTTNVTFKKWNAGVVMRASFGNYVYNNNYSQTGVLSQITGNSVLYNASSNYLTTKFKGGNAQELLSDYYIQNASFLRMDNLNFGYNVGRIYHDKASLRLSATVQNVFVVTKYKGLDPEISSGIDNSLYPRARIFSFGLNLGF